MDTWNGSQIVPDNLYCIWEIRPRTDNAVHKTRVIRVNTMPIAKRPCASEHRIAVLVCHCRIDNLHHPKRQDLQSQGEYHRRGVFGSAYIRLIGGGWLSSL